eukprot:Phypoly_transcript_00368.p1 GENE.Phypoly_transcript_00368~~Phypoly_transcript_00368.p1  ORF type:complete len:1106 (+),score=136.69 Phypoly_transcript_00368:1680-4997(+)
MNVAHQGLLEHVVRDIFPHECITVNTVKEATIKNPVTGQLLELDCWIPTLQLGFEFQDVYHYATTWFSNSTLASIQGRDKAKYTLAHRGGTTLISVPFWWDGSKSSLVATLLFHRPDLEIVDYDLSTKEMILLNAPGNFQADYVPGVGELMLASFPEMGEFQRSVSNSNPWWMGEKYDGVRFCWNYVQPGMYTRSGMPFSLLSSFAPLLPSHFIDGEVWMGRGGFASSQRLIYSKDMSWEFLRLITFDIPTTGNCNITCTSTFEDRYSTLATLDPHHPFIILAPRMLCVDQKGVSFFLKNVMDDGGEGIILRKPGSFYVHGRSDALVKLKASRGDQEAIILKLEGNYVVLKMPDLRTFSVHLSNVQVSSSLRRGDIVSFSYEKLSRNSLPIDPKIYKIRKDISWSDVLLQSKAQEPNRFSSQLAKLPTKIQRTHAKNLRTTLESIARAQGLDPLSPSTWYNASPKEIIAKTQPGTIIFKALQGGYAQTIVTLFPDIGIVESKFASTLRNWSDIRKRRRQLETFAKENNFNPLVPENWINKTISDPKVVKIQSHYGNLTECLLHLFPEIGLDKHMFFPSEYWKDPKNGRKFFENFAEKQGFDPLIAQNWYTVEHTDIETFKGAKDVLHKFHGSHRAALLKVFPEIGLEREKIQSKNYGLAERKRVLVEFAKLKGFDPLIPNNWATVTTQSLFAYPGPKRVIQRYGSVKNALLAVFKFEDVPTVYQPKYYWRNAGTRRKFFERFAAKNGFDPLIATNWYNLNRAKIIKDPDSGGVLNYYNGSISKALMHLFPDIGLDPLSFANAPKNIWENVCNVRRWFENFATQRGFDPLHVAEWYQIKTEDITSVKGGWAILNKHGASMSQAIINTFPDIGLDRLLFHRGPNSNLNDAEKGRIFFENFAQQKGFDPLIPENWYKLPQDLFEKLRASNLAKRTTSVPTALQHYFPDMKWEGHKFTKVARNFWSDPTNQKQLLIDFARSQYFDPNILENWSNTSPNDIAKMKGGRDVLAPYGGNVLKAVTELLSASWKDKSAHPSMKTRRAFFLKFAKAKDFDPLEPENWYKCSKKAILRTPGARNILFYHNNLISQALLDLFPKIGLDKVLFKKNM